MPAKLLVSVIVLIAVALGAGPAHAGRLVADPRPERCVGEVSAIPTKVHNRSAQTAHLTLRIVRPRTTIHRFVTVEPGESARLVARAREGVGVGVKIMSHRNGPAQNGGRRLERFDLIGGAC